MLEELFVSINGPLPSLCELWRTGKIAKAVKAAM